MAMVKPPRIDVAGHRGLVGTAILRCLKGIDSRDVRWKTHEELDLMKQEGVDEFFSKERPEDVFLAVAKAGGIFANSSYLADIMYSKVLM